MRATTPLIMTGILCFTGCSKEDIGSQKAPKIEAIRRQPLASRLALEGEDEVILRTNGREFHKVRGAMPYYVPIKDSNVIYFVTDAPMEESICHVYDLATGKDIAIRTHFSELGYGVGETGESREVVESASRDFITVARFYGHRKTLYTLDLGKKQITDMRVIEIGGSTNAAPSP